MFNCMATFTVSDAPRAQQNIPVVKSICSSLEKGLLLTVRIACQDVCINTFPHSLLSDVSFVQQRLVSLGPPAQFVLALCDLPLFSTMKLILWEMILAIYIPRI